MYTMLVILITDLPLKMYLQCSYFCYDKSLTTYDQNIRSFDISTSATNPMHVCSMSDYIHSFKHI